MPEHGCHSDLALRRWPTPLNSCRFGNHSWARASWSLGYGTAGISCARVLKAKKHDPRRRPPSHPVWSRGTTPLGRRHRLALPGSRFWSEMSAISSRTPIGASAAHLERASLCPGCPAGPPRLTMADSRAQPIKHRRLKSSCALSWRCRPSGE